MKCGAQMAVAAAGGYLLGRSRKAKWALVLGGMAAGRVFGGSPSELLEQGTKSLRSPELNKLSGDIGGPLAQAGRAAVVKAASSQMESLTDRLNDRAESLRDSGATVDEAQETSADSEEVPPSGEGGGEGTRSGQAARKRASPGSSGSGTRETARTAKASRAGGASSRSTGSSGKSGSSRTRSSSDSGSRQRTHREAGEAPRRQQRRSTGSSGGGRRREGGGDG